MSDIRFEDCLFYDCADSETLDHESPEDAIESTVDAWCEPNCDIKAVVEKLGPITVKGYVREQVSDIWRNDVRSQMFSLLMEEWDSEYGDAEEGTELNADKMAIINADISSAIATLERVASVWRCKQVASRTYSTAEVLAIVEESKEGGVTQ